MGRTKFAWRGEWSMIRMVVTANISMPVANPVIEERRMSVTVAMIKSVSVGMAEVSMSVTVTMMVAAVHEAHRHHCGEPNCSQPKQNVVDEHPSSIYTHWASE